MKAMVLRQTADLTTTDTPLEWSELPDPQPAPDELLLQVLTCGVCHTELDEIEGRLPARFPVIPGHEVVGQVIQTGADVDDSLIGKRMGVGWIHHSDGRPDENLSPSFRSTGCQENGGYAELMTVPANYACPIPDAFTDEQAAPLLCAGAIGYRALRLTNLKNGQPLGLTGFGGSGHLVIQLAKKMFPDSELFVFARDPEVRQFAVQLGACWAGDTDQASPRQLQAIIDTTPAWKPVVEALKNLRPGGRLVINAIRKEDADKNYLQHLNYHEDLWLEREIKSVANITYDDIRQFLPLAASIPIQPTVETYPLQEANRALVELKRGQVRGAKVLKISPSPA